jgi:hypothetical protein
MHLISFLPKASLQARSRSGFTIAELLITIGISVLISSIAIPKLLAARPAANESAAISTLRALATAQAQMKGAVTVDCDWDGSGEYGFLGELSGATALRESDGTGGIQLGTSFMAPDALSAAFGDVQGGVVRRSGYFFAVFLPDGQLAPAGVGEAADGGWEVGTPIGLDAAENYWCAYAWPDRFGRTGKRAFFVNQTGDLLQYNNRNAIVYEGQAGGPAWNSAFVQDDMSAATANSAAGPIGMDGNPWTVVQ